MRFIFSLLFYSLCHWLVAQNFPDGPYQKKLSGKSDREKIAYINNNFYTIYSDDFGHAKKLTNWAAEVSHANKWKEDEAYSLMNFGVVSYLRGEYEEALPAYLRSYDLFDSLMHWKGLGMLYTEMANYYQKQGYLEKAYAFLDSADVLTQRSGDLRTSGKSYGMRATLLFRTGKVEKARPFYNKVYEIYRALDDSVGLGYVLLDQAIYAQRDGDFRGALAFIDESTGIRELIGDRQAIAENLDFLGDTYLRAEKYVEALLYYQKCANYSKTIGYVDQLRKAYDQLALTETILDNYKQAYAYQDSSHLLKDSLFNLERSRTIEELQTRYETEKKEQQIAIQDLQLSEQRAMLDRTYILISALVLFIIFIVVIGWLLRNRTLRKQQLILQQKDIEYKQKQLDAVIRSQEEERQRVATDLHDGFGQSISILKMNIGAIRKKGQTAEIFNKSDEILDGMYDELRGICFNLMPKTLLDHGLVAALNEFGNRINLAGEVRMEILIFDFQQRLERLVEISIYRIIQEWVNNILKYNIAKNITIQLTCDEAELTVVIEDDGQGFDKDQLIHGSGNGWRNMNSRATLIKADLDIETQPGKEGTMLALNVPLS